MITAHFNGELVRHKDTKKINQDRQLLYASEGRCKYGIHNLKCESWVNYCQQQPEVKAISDFGKCSLGNCVLCPNYRQRKDAGNKEKTFTIDGKVYRKLASAAHWMLKEGEFRTVFLTLTFGNFKIDTTKINLDETTNQLFSRFAENLRKNYSCRGYIAVKEYGETTNRVHFHFIACLPFIPYHLLNDIWNNTISDISHYSNCALRTDKNKSSIIRNPNRAIRYVCKYLSKQYGRTSSTRIVFISNNILKRPISIDEQLPRFGDYYLKEFKSLKTKVYEHVTVFYVTDPKEFNKFCWKFLYPLFECSVKPSRFDYLSSVSPP